MLYVIAALITLTVTLTGVAVAQALPARNRTVTRRLAELQRLGNTGLTIERRKRQERRAKVERVLQQLGSRMEARRTDNHAMRQYLVQAGFRGSGALAILWGSRLVLAGGLALVTFAVLSLGATSTNRLVGMTLAAAALGWIGPSFYVGKKRRARMKEVQRALPDALDLMVVCVEAGLGLNQALARVSEEMRHVSKALSEEFTNVNLEIRAGVERAEALRHLGDRTGVEDVRTLTAILIQTERFGTSVATALRTQADTMRIKRRQRAEEAAAKATIKLVPPLVFCVFPAIFAVILGPAMIQLIRYFVMGQ